MKIYQLHKYGGEWEDAYDYIVGSYLRKERAEEERVKAETKEKELAFRGKKCNNCPFIEQSFEDLDDLLSEYPNYCNESKLIDEGAWGMDCENYYSHRNESTFKIKEVEVEE